MSSTMRLLLSIAAVAMLSLMAACASSPESNLNDPTTQALSNPMGYSPDMDDTDINGGGIGDFNNKSFQKDVDHVLNP